MAVRIIPQCKDCSAPIYADVNMVMLKDRIWKLVCDDFMDYICAGCIEKRLGRKLVEADFKTFNHLGKRQEIKCNTYYKKRQGK